MNDLYLRAMRSASRILFAVALLLPIAALATSTFLDTGFGFSVFRFLIGVLQALQSALLPLFGAALLWRIDVWLAHQGKPMGASE